MPHDLKVSSRSSFGLLPESGKKVYAIKLPMAIKQKIKPTKPRQPPAASFLSAVAFAFSGAAICFATGNPQDGQATADSDTSFLHSGHLIMLFLSCW